MGRRLLEAPQEIALRDLLAVLTSTAVADRLLDRFPCAHALSQAGARELEGVRDVSPHEALRLAAACEVGRRALRPPWDDDDPFDTPESVWHEYRARLGALPHERLIALGLDGRCRRVVEVQVAEGGPARCAVEPGQVFRPLLRAGAHGALLVHNHPSGDPSPSEADRSFTRRLAAAGEVLGVEVVDHIVVARHGYHSMAESGVLR